MMDTSPPVPTLLPLDPPLITTDPARALALELPALTVTSPLTPATAFPVANRSGPDAPDALDAEETLLALLLLERRLVCERLPLGLALARDEAVRAEAEEADGEERGPRAENHLNNNRKASTDCVVLA